MWGFIPQICGVCYINIDLYKQCYGKIKVEPESLNKLIETLNATGLEMVKFNKRGFKYQNHEVPYVEKWITEKEQELKYLEQHPIKNKPKNKTDKISKWIKLVLHKIPKTLYEIIIGVIIIVLGYFVLWGIYNYWHINLKP